MRRESLAEESVAQWDGSSGSRSSPSTMQASRKFAVQAPKRGSCCSGDGSQSRRCKVSFSSSSGHLACNSGCPKRFTAWQPMSASCQWRARRAKLYWTSALEKGHRVSSRQVPLKVKSFTSISAVFTAPTTLPLTTHLLMQTMFSMIAPGRHAECFAYDEKILWKSLLSHSSQWSATSAIRRTSLDGLSIRLTKSPRPRCSDRSNCACMVV
mmetsp:Transcript_52368/g.169930  ORF Transcript_52368/g.169930 Transcript_52368/m.169930 type:complete len:211 (+) Transcript_52368:1175-1807(+)